MFKRRAATQFIGALFRGLKATATVGCHSVTIKRMLSAEDGADANKDSCILIFVAKRLDEGSCGFQTHGFGNAQSLRRVAAIGGRSNF